MEVRGTVLLFQGDLNMIALKSSWQPISVDIHSLTWSAWQAGR